VPAEPRPPAGSGIRADRPRWVRDLGLVALTLVIAAALVAMELFSMLVLELLR